MACDLTIKNLQNDELDDLKKRYKKLKNQKDINSFDNIELFDVYYYEVEGDRGVQKMYFFNPMKLKNEVIRLEREQKLNKLRI